MALIRARAALEPGAARWKTVHQIRKSVAGNKDPALAVVTRGPDAEIYAIDVPFDALKDKAELDYRDQQPTTFVLPDEAVDHLRAAAGTTITDAPEFKRLLKDVGVTLCRRRRPRRHAPHGAIGAAEETFVSGVQNCSSSIASALSAP